MENKEFALGRNKKVNLWCYIEKIENNIIHFHVINGGWQGTIIGKKLMTIKDTKENFQIEYLWEGEAPFNVSRYNEAIDWIEKQI